jgi:hypothetical protein
MEQSPWESNSRSGCQEIPRLFRNLEVNFLARKSPPPVAILNQISAVHIPKLRATGILTVKSRENTIMMIITSETAEAVGISRASLDVKRFQ